tara:strand:- start:689 stop:820 length:132 start_codon:yes stop_codon:yes gene_type:complete
MMMMTKQNKGTEDLRINFYEEKEKNISRKKKKKTVAFSFSLKI